MKIDSNAITGGFLKQNVIVDPQFIVNGSYVTFDQIASHFAGLFLAAFGDDSPSDEMVGYPAIAVAGLPGTPGATGSPGATGNPGRDGFDGESGEDAFSIPGQPGQVGPQGSHGIDGQDADEPMFIPPIQGDRGLQGLQGPIGNDGSDAEDGLTIVGPQGPQGLVAPIAFFMPDEPIEGDTGIPGTTGLQGLKGDQGLPGTDGDPGEDAPVIPGPIGCTGKSGINGAQPDDLIALLNYAFKRIKFLEDCEKIVYGPNDIAIPSQVTLLSGGM